MISEVRGRARALTMMLGFRRLLARALSRLPRVSYRIRQRIQPVQHLQAHSVHSSRIAGPSRTRPLKTLALVAGVFLPTIAGFALWSIERGDQPFANAALAKSPAHSVQTSPVPNEPRSVSSSLPTPRLVPIEPITTASIPSSTPIPMTGAVVPLRPAQPREPVTKMPEPAAKAPELPAPPAAHSSPALSSAEASAYLRRADTAMRDGDVVGARSLFDRLAQAGDPRGAAGMARTYDEAEFKKLGVYGLKPDRREAERWRARARELTSAAARN